MFFTPSFVVQFERTQFVITIIAKYDVLYMLAGVNSVILWYLMSVAALLWSMSPVPHRLIQLLWCGVVCCLLWSVLLVALMLAF